MDVVIGARSTYRRVENGILLPLSYVFALLTVCLPSWDFRGEIDDDKWQVAVTATIVAAAGLEDDTW